MKRNPEEIAMQKHAKKIKYIKFTPKLFWYQCCKCGNEFKSEAMYAVKYPLIIGCNFMTERYGCSHCFKDMEEFKEFTFAEYIRPTIEGEA